jgi:hypothetical protein
MDAIPTPYFQEVYRDTRYFVLRILGRNTNLFQALLSTTVIATGAAVAEEIFFRGFCFTAFENAFHSDVVALLASSAIFGLAHFPVFGANALIEAVLGGFIGYAYMTTGHNLAVPIVIHGVYDFLTIMKTWIEASGDLKNRLLDATEYQLAKEAKDPEKFKKMSRAVSASTVASIIYYLASIIHGLVGDRCHTKQRHEC